MQVNCNQAFFCFCHPIPPKNRIPSCMLECGLLSRCINKTTSRNNHWIIFLKFPLSKKYTHFSAQSTFLFLDLCSRSRTVPTNGKYFFPDNGYVRQVDYIRGYWNPNRKLGVTTHFSEITALQYGEKRWIGIF